jgi:catechol 2,3-dioxygenase-like lactoylglutathione lyase family enzyme
MSFLSHVDVRVRDMAAARRFYDPFLAAMGAPADAGKTFTTYEIPGGAGDWFGITEDREFAPGPARIAFRAADRAAVDRIAALLPGIGAKNVEMDDGVYGDQYYAVFFEDPDGNALEVCYVGP